MIKVEYFQPSPDDALTFVVIAARIGDKFIYCKKRGRESWELPGGHIEPGESDAAAARRELYEETGLDGDMLRLCGYKVTSTDASDKCGERGGVSLGALYFCRVTPDISADVLIPPPEYEMECARAFVCPPSPLTYPEIQTEL
ncbi:MAG: NUDIX hydrolase, partial [Eubacteriales bacterium]